MRKILSVILLVLFCLSSKADVIFSFSSGSIGDSALKNWMEKSVSNLLSEINRAAISGEDLAISEINMEEGAKERLIALWGNIRFQCEDEYPVSKCLNDHQGYQIRNIKIMMIPLDDTYDGKIHRELTISLNRNGAISGVRPAMELEEDVSRIMGEGTDVSDLTMRREILKWVEDFRNYYNERNITSLEQIYSDYALIITGSVMKQRLSGSSDSGVRIRQKEKYTVQSKAEYINKLKKIFNNNKYLNVTFDKITVVRHGAKPNIYGVTLRQSWTSSGYSDVGWLFLLWDFNDRECPQIHVRTWQSEEMVASDGVFSLPDFFIP